MGVRTTLALYMDDGARLRIDNIHARQLTASDINFAVVRPLVFKYAKLENIAVVYACFVVRSHFLSEAEDNLAYSGVLLSRAALCEILAMKLLGSFATSSLRVATVLTASWNPLAGAPEQVINDVRQMIGEDGTYDPQCALEVRTHQRTFYTHLTCLLYRIVDGHCHRIQGVPRISTRTIGYERDILRPNGLHYDVTPLGPGGQLQTSQHRGIRRPKGTIHRPLQVTGASIWRYPRVLELRAALDYVFAMPVQCVTTPSSCSWVRGLTTYTAKNLNEMNGFEKVFILFATAFALEEYTASKEHGWTSGCDHSMA